MKRAETPSFTASRFAALVGVDRGHLIRKLEEIGAKPVSEDGRGAAFSMRHLFQAATGGNAAAERLRKTKAEADVLEHKLAVARKEYMPVQECANIVLNCGWSIRRVILSLPIPDREKDSLLGDLQKLAAEWQEIGDQLALKAEPPPQPGED
ncbi:MAG: hypothetical protein WEB53_09315 [Akkermansiaceae bacterium]